MMEECVITINTRKIEHLRQTVKTVMKKNCLQDLKFLTNAQLLLMRL